MFLVFFIFCVIGSAALFRFDKLRYSLSLVFIEFRRPWAIQGLFLVLYFVIFLLLITSFFKLISKYWYFSYFIIAEFHVVSVSYVITCEGNPRCQSLCYIDAQWTILFWSFWLFCFLIYTNGICLLNHIKLISILVYTTNMTSENTIQFDIGVYSRIPLNR